MTHKAMPAETLVRGSQTLEEWLRGRDRRKNNPCSSKMGVGGLSPYQKQTLLRTLQTLTIRHQLEPSWCFALVSKVSVTHSV